MTVLQGPVQSTVGHSAMTGMPSMDAFHWFGTDPSLKPAHWIPFQLPVCSHPPTYSLTKLRAAPAVTVPQSSDRSVPLSSERQSSTPKIIIVAACNNPSSCF